MLNGNGYSQNTNSNSSATQSFIHYTSEQRWKSIYASGEIRISTYDSGKAHFGEGVYGTTLRPEEGKMRIAENNWFWWHAKNYVASGRVDVAIELEIPATKVQKVGQWYRDILVHVEPIRLNDYKCKVWLVPADPVFAQTPRQTQKDEHRYTDDEHIECMGYDDDILLEDLGYRDIEYEVDNDLRDNNGYQKND